MNAFTVSGLDKSAFLAKNDSAFLVNSIELSAYASFFIWNSRLNISL